MGTRALLVVLGGVVLVAMAVGGLVGDQYAEEASSGVGTAGNDSTPPAVGATETPDTPDGSTPTATPTATPAPNASTPDPFDPASVDAAAVEAAIDSAVDAFRSGAGRGPLDREARLDAMAEFHSDNMAGQGYPAHDAAGYTTVERYEQFDRFSHCRVPSDGNSGVRTGEEIELVGRIELDTDDVPDEGEIAAAMVAEWRADGDEERKLRYRNADRAGIGVNVTEEAHVYVTLDLC
jgi:hypothetical protein